MQYVCARSNILGTTCLIKLNLSSLLPLFSLISYICFFKLIEVTQGHNKLKITNLFIDILAFLTLLSSVLVITSTNPVISVIFLISVFINAAGYLILSSETFSVELVLKLIKIKSLFYYL